MSKTRRVRFFFSWGLLNHSSTAVVLLYWLTPVIDLILPFVRSSIILLTRPITGFVELMTLHLELCWKFYLWSLSETNACFGRRFVDPVANVYFSSYVDYIFIIWTLFKLTYGIVVLTKFFRLWTPPLKFTKMSRVLVLKKSPSTFEYAWCSFKMYFVLVAVLEISVVTHTPTHARTYTHTHTIRHHYRIDSFAFYQWIKQACNFHKTDNGNVTAMLTLWFVSVWPFSKVQWILSSQWINLVLVYYPG